MGKISKALNKVAPPPGSHLNPPVEYHESQDLRSKAEKTTTTVQPSITHPPSPTETSTDKWDERLLDASKNYSGVAESFRKLRTMILHPESGNPARTIMTLSSDPQEGKSFVCANLGISLAHSVEQQALMIDCDLRRPSLQGLFGLKHPKGLTNYLRDGDNVADLIYPTGLPKLSIIPSGPPPDNPSELLSSDKMSLLIKELTQMYDDRLILLDTPPFHAASETLVLSQLVDKFVVVVRWGKSGRENVKKMIDQIGREKVIGVVFNAFEMNILDRKIQGVGYHNYYSESYY